MLRRMFFVAQAHQLPSRTVALADLELLNQLPFGEHALFGHVLLNDDFQNSVVDLIHQRFLACGKHHFLHHVVHVTPPFLFFPDRLRRLPDGSALLLQKSAKPVHHISAIIITQ